MPTLPLPARPRAPERTTLALLGLIEATLPPDLRRVQAAARYTVAAHLSRRATPRERTLVGEPTVARVLADLGYARVTLKVLDRRLLIENTTVAMLERGLAREIQAILRAVERHALDDRSGLAALSLQPGDAAPARPYALPLRRS